MENLKREDESVEPMEADHFDATTEYLRRQRGKRQKDTVVAAARAVLVDGTTSTLAGAEFGVEASVLSRALKRYPEAFQKMIDEAGKVVTTVVVSPEYAALLKHINVTELEDVKRRLDQKKRG